MLFMVVMPEEEEMLVMVVFPLKEDLVEWEDMED